MTAESDTFNQLPLEVVSLIPEYLDTSTLKELCQVNKFFYSLLCDSKELLVLRFFELISLYEEYILDTSKFKESFKISWGRLAHIENAFKAFLGNWVLQIDPYGGLVRTVLKGTCIKAYFIVPREFADIRKVPLFKIELQDLTLQSSVYHSKCNMFKKCSHDCQITILYDDNQISLQCKKPAKHSKDTVYNKLQRSYADYHVNSFSKDFAKQIKKKITLNKIVDTPDSKMSTGNLFVGEYNVHGIEFQHWQQINDHLTLTKISGDPNVPFQNITIDVDLAKYVDLDLAISHDRDSLNWINDCLVPFNKTTTIRTFEFVNGLELEFEAIPPRLEDLLQMKEFPIQGVYKGKITLRMLPQDFFYNEIIVVIVDEGLLITIWDIHDDGYNPDASGYMVMPKFEEIISIK